MAVYYSIRLPGCVLTLHHYYCSMHTFSHRYKSNINGLLKGCFSSGGAPRCLRQYLEYVHGLEYEAVPDYSQMKALFLDELKSHGIRDDGKDLDWMTVKKRVCRKCTD